MGQVKFAGQRLAFYHCATQPTKHEARPLVVVSALCFLCSLTLVWVNRKTSGIAPKKPPQLSPKFLFQNKCRKKNEGKLVHLDKDHEMEVSMYALDIAR